MPVSSAPVPPPSWLTLRAVLCSPLSVYDNPSLNSLPSSSYRVKYHKIAAVAAPSPNAVTSPARLLILAK